MAGLSFSAQIEKELGDKVSHISKVVTSSAKAAWRTAVDASPVDTGTLRYHWKISTSRRSSYVPKRVNRGRPSVPRFNFRASKDKRLYFYNNTEYASFVEHGEGPGVRKAHMMLAKARARFEAETSRGFAGIK